MKVNRKLLPIDSKELLKLKKTIKYLTSVNMKKCQNHQDIAEEK